jgi:spore coat polysaccharide biosynthesis protein SpsF (cytidylyltransferase family)
MKTVAIIQARMGSTRLPGKVLMPVMGRPLLQWMLDRIATCKDVDEIIVATTTNDRDEVIAKFTESLGYRVFRGSEDDVLDRYYHAASLVHCDAVIRITADCPLLDPNILGKMINDFEMNKLDFLSNSEPLPSSWPDGMDVSIVRFSALMTAWRNAIKPSEREHVTFHFWNNQQIYKCMRIDHNPDLAKYRLTIDYIEDYEVLKAVIEHFASHSIEAFGRVSVGEIIDFLNNNPAIFNLNQKYTRGLGWQDSLRRDKELGF